MANSMPLLFSIALNGFPYSSVQSSTLSVQGGHGNAIKRNTYRKRAVGSSACRALSIYIVKTKLYTVEKGAYIVKERVSSWKTALQ